VPNFVVIGQTITEIWRFLILQDGGWRKMATWIPPSWILKTGIFNSRYGDFSKWRLLQCSVFKISNF